MIASGLRLASAAAGFAVILCAYVFGLRDPLASMTSYTAALMAMNQLVPPFLLVALPPRWGRGSWLADIVFDPGMALVCFIAVGVAISLPSVLDPSLANALFATPLGLLELATGLMIWGQMLSSTRRLRRGWQVAALIWLASLPMAAVSIVWMLSPRVLHAPYLDVVCRWNLPPLLDQKWAGLVSPPISREGEGQCQAKPRPAELSGGESSDLMKRVNKARHLLWTDADAVVANRERDPVGTLDPLVPR